MSLPQETILLKQALAGEGFSITELPFRPIAENLAKHFYKILQGEGIPVCSVAVYETAENCAVYEEDQNVPNNGKIHKH